MYMLQNFNYCDIFHFQILANKFFQTVLLNRKKNIVMEKIFQLKLPLKKFYLENSLFNLTSI